MSLAEQQQEQAFESMAFNEWSKAQDEAEKWEEATYKIKCALDEMNNWRHLKEVRRDIVLAYLKEALRLLGED